MIIANDDLWIIGTNTKCGTETLERYLCKTLKVAWCTRPRHVMEIPRGLENAKRYMTRRDPYERFVSAWWHYFKEPFWHRNEPHTDINDWAQEFFERWHAGDKRSWIWCSPCSVQQNRFGASKVVTFDVSELDELCIAAGAPPGVNDFKTNVKPRRTRSTDVLGTEETLEMLTDTNKLNLENWAKFDCDHYAYPRRHLA